MYLGISWISSPGSLKLTCTFAIHGIVLMMRNVEMLYQTEQNIPGQDTCVEYSGLTDTYSCGGYTAWTDFQRHHQSRLRAGC